MLVSVKPLTENNEISSRWIGVAALDWESAGLANFYPEDVPDDWHLTWYANVSMAVVVPPSRWLSADAALVAQWREQTHENFWFYLQCETTEQVTQASVLCAAFMGKFAGLIVSAGVVGDTPSVPVLILGESSLLLAAKDLRAARIEINAWLASFNGDHGLVILNDTLAAQIKEVQTLLELMGVLS
jgi:hypothetical protein